MSHFFRSASSQRKAAKGKAPRRGANHRRKLQVKRFRRRNRFAGQGLIRGVFLLSVSAALVLAGGAAGWRAYKAYREGQILTVNRIEVTGNRYWEASKLLETSGLEVGARLPGISLSKARDAIRQLPGIQDVKVGRNWSGTVRVQVREEEILALGPEKRGGWSGLTLSGKWTQLASLGEGSDLPIVEGRRKNNPALASYLADVRRSYPDLFVGFSQIVPSSDQGAEAEIYWRDGRVKVRVDYTNKSLNSLEFLRTLLRREGEDWPPGSTVDLRVEGYAYVL